MTAPLCAGILLLSAAPALAAPETTGLGLSVPATASVGDTITLGVELGDTADVYAYALTVATDPEVLTVDSATGPAGGFDSTELTGPHATVVHTRLGSSPALAGDLAAGVELDVVGPGTTSVEVSVELVGADGTTTTLPAVTSAEILVAAPTPAPTDPTDPEPTDPEPTDPDPSPTAPVPSDDDGAPAATAPPTSGGGSLPSTGLDPRGIGAAAAVLAALGGAALLVRRRTGGAL